MEARELLELGSALDSFDKWLATVMAEAMSFTAAVRAAERAQLQEQTSDNSEREGQYV